MIKRIVVILTLISIFALPVFSYESIEEYITPEMEENLPSDVLDGENLIDYGGLAEVLLENVAELLPNVLKHLLSLISVVILSAVFNIFSDSVRYEGVRRCFCYLSSVAVAIIVFQVLSDIWTRLEDLMAEMNTFMLGLTPATSLLYAVGGNVTAASVNASAMSIILTVFENLCYYGIKPMLAVCYGISIAATISGSINLQPLSNFVRRSYTTVLIFIISSMTCLLSLQNMLAGANDSLGARTIKFATASAVPLVGGCLSETTSTMAAGVGSIRSCFGVLAILAIAIMVLPTIVALFLNKLAFSVGNVICNIFGLNREAGLVNGGCELINFALAVLISSTVMFVISISLFAGASTALGG